ncbi:ATP-binding cassette domain-containing protein [Variovorax sp. LjRoot130]|uniref:ABC transporter ATP-binding protein n=1 Tax=Variovorax sp. LjRoot130 TaxID=3342261 RepID=UPI003ECEC1CF
MGIEKRFGVHPSAAAAWMARFGIGNPPGEVHAVRHVELLLHAGEVVGLVGESGCGKSTLGRIAAGIAPPSEGEIRYGGENVLTMDRAGRRAFELGVQMVFQNPFASLNPRIRVGDAIGEAPRVHGIVAKAELDDCVAGLMQRVGLDPSYRHRFPHQFSGGQRQRIVIARALGVRPKVLVCDEAVAALDVSVQAQVLNLFMDLRRDMGLAYLFISHNLAVVERIADRVLIMYLGRIVEAAPARELFIRPAHPYTRALLDEVPSLDGGSRTYVPIKGELPSPMNPPGGCAFHPRCPHAMPVCATESPQPKTVAPGHWSACHLNS